MLQAAMAPGAATAPFVMDVEVPESGWAPPAIRLEIAKRVAANLLSDAERLLTEGLRRFPDSEDLLVMQALLAEIRLDWAAADRALQKLLSVQGSQAPVASWLHWVRVLRCLQQADRAVEALGLAFKHHPHDDALRAEAVALGVPPPPLKRQAA